jgi:hypothetical protein
MPAKEATAKVVEKKQTIFAKQTVLIKVGVKNISKKLAVMVWKDPLPSLSETTLTHLLSP